MRKKELFQEKLLGIPLEFQLERFPRIHSSLRTKSSSKAEVFQPRAALEAGEVVPTQGRWECQGTEQEDVPRAKFLLTKAGFRWETFPERRCEQSQEKKLGFSLGWGIPPKSYKSQGVDEPFGEKKKKKILGAEFQQESSPGE